MRTSVCCVVLVAPVMALALPADGALINEVSPDTLTTNTLEDLEALSGGTYPGTNYDGIIHADGISFAECFNGQQVTSNGYFDEVTGLPAGPLQLVPGAAGENLTIWGDGNQVIAGNGGLGFPEQNAVSEGAFAFMFDHDQAEIGFELLGLNGGAVMIDFFGRDGSLLDSKTVYSLEDGLRAFRVDGDSTGIAGVVVTTDDLGGIGFDNFFFSAPVPGPGALALLGLAMLVPTRRRR